MVYSSITGLIAFFPLFYYALQIILSDNASSVQHFLLYIIIFVLGILCIELAGFSVIHLKLVSKNQTLIEYSQDSNNSQYSVGTYENFIQVFGENLYMWPLPFYGKAGRIKCDGINWSV